MLVGCSLWLPFIERPRRLKSWLPWRHLQTTALPLMCHCHHLFVRSVWKTTLFPSSQFPDTDSRIEHCATVTGPEPPRNKMCCSIIFTLAQLIQTNWRQKMHVDWVNVSLFNHWLCVHLCKQVKPGRWLYIKIQTVIWWVLTDCNYWRKTTVVCLSPLRSFPCLSNSNLSHRLWEERAVISRKKKMLCSLLHCWVRSAKIVSPVLWNPEG